MNLDFFSPLNYNSCLTVQLSLYILRQQHFFKVLHSISVLQPFLGGSCSVNQINGKIFVGEELLATVEGHWVRAFIPLFVSAASVSL